MDVLAKYKVNVSYNVGVDIYKVLMGTKLVYKWKFEQKEKFVLCTKLGLEQQLG